MNKILKDLQKLTQKKYRLQNNLFFIEGKKNFQECIKSNINFKYIVVTNEFYEQNRKILNKLDNLFIVEDNDFKKLSVLETPQGIITYIEKNTVLINDISENNIIFINEISDPGNLGTIIRIADWFGFKEMIISKNSVELFNPKVIQASMGSIFHNKFLINVDPISYIEKLKKLNYEIILADLNGENIYKTNYSKNKNIFVLSNEANGPSDEIIKLSDKIVTIPKFGDAESLNVAVSCGIILSDFKSKQQ
jgi:TrmH family RNA methyltransferase